MFEKCWEIFYTKHILTFFWCPLRVNRPKDEHRSLGNGVRKKWRPQSVSVSMMWGRYWNSVSASLLERILLVFASPCGKNGVDTEFPYRVRIVDREVDCRDPVCRHRFRFLENRDPSQDRRDKMEILLVKFNRNGRFVPGTGPGLFQARFVPGTVPVCPGHRPAQNVYVLTSPDPPESVECYISVWKIETEEKNKKSPKFVRYFSAIFPIFRNSWKSEKIRPNLSAQKITLRKTWGLFFWISPPHSSDLGNREKLFFRFLFFLAFSRHSFFLDFCRIGRFVVHRGPSIYVYWFFFSCQTKKFWNLCHSGAKVAARVPGPSSQQ